MNQYDNAVPHKKSSGGKRRVSKENVVSVDSDDVPGNNNILICLNPHPQVAN